MNLILLLEDHALLRRSMAEALSDLPNTQVTAVGTLQDAMKRLAERQPDLIVSDLDLPDGSGIELLGHLGRPPVVPVVFVSGHIPQFQSRLCGFPGITVRHKPLGLRELQELAHEHLESIVDEAPFSAADYVQLACMGRHSVRIEVEAPDLRGTIIVKDGQLWSAHCGDAQGIDALRRLSIEHTALSRCVTLRSVRALRNLPAEKSWEQLLLDAARAHDEDRRSTRPAQALTTSAFVDEETDFSELFTEPQRPSRAASDPIQPVPSSALPLPWEAEEPEEFDLLVERGADALLSKDYLRALSLYQHAYTLRPQDTLVAANIVRLREITKRNEQNQ